jgi:hypothetical protein
MAERRIEISIASKDSYTTKDSLSVTISVPEEIVDAEFLALRDVVRGLEDRIRASALVARA